MIILASGACTTGQKFAVIKNFLFLNETSYVH